VATSHALVVLAVAADVGLGQLNAPRGVTYFAGLFYLYMSYLHLARVRVVDLRQLLGNTLALGLLATGLVSLFAGLHLWVGARFDLFVLNAFLASFVLLLFFDTMRRGVQHATDRWLVGAKIALERSLSPLGSRLSQVLTLDELLREFLHTLERTERVTSSSIFLRDDPHMGFQLSASIGLSPRARVNLIREPAFVQALQRGEVLIAEDLDRVEPGERFPIPAEEREVLLRSTRELDAQVIIPLRAGPNLVGFWTLTEARSAEPFSTEEVRLLRDLAARAAVSIENSKTFERIRARDRLVALGEMAGGLAHEIRNPIATIRAGLDLLERPGEEDPGEIRHLIVEEVHRLDRVVGLFLDYARPSPSCKTPQDVVKVLERSVDSARSRYAGTPVAVELQTEEDLPPMPVDGPQLERIVSNLVRNASEACEPGGSVRVSAQAVRTPEGGLEGLEIVVDDEGCGMSEATLSRALIPFFTTKERGVGLGLALCERLVRGQGGEIELRSNSGEGTRVRVWIPVSIPPEMEPDEDGEP
jgi:signal transduction histidine kinase